MKDIKGKKLSLSTTEVSVSAKKLIGTCCATLAIGSVLMVSQFAGADPSPTKLESMVDEQLSPRRTLKTKPKPRVVASQELDLSDPIRVAGKIALAGFTVAAVVFMAALYIKRTREDRLQADTGSSLAVRDSVWIGRGQRIILLALGDHKVLVGVSGNTIHGLGVFEKNEGVDPSLSPIERDAAFFKSQDSEFADFVKGELAQSLGGTGGKDKRRKLITELNSL